MWPVAGSMVVTSDVITGGGFNFASKRGSGDSPKSKAPVIRAIPARATTPHTFIVGNLSKSHLRCSHIGHLLGWASPDEAICGRN
jgi:hypothetical protein